MRPLRVASVVSAAACVVVAVACSAFESDDVPAALPDESLPATSDDASSPPVGDAPDAETDARPACAVRPPSCTLTQCKVVPLYKPPTPSSPFGIVTDDEFVYWLEQGTDSNGFNGHGPATLRRVPKTGGAPQTLAKNQPQAQALARVGKRLYWVTYNGGISRPTLWSTPVDALCIGDDPCPPPREEATFEANDHVQVLRAGAPGVLYALGRDIGHVYRIDVDTQPALSTGSLAQVGAYSALAASDTFAWVIGGYREALLRSSGTDPTFAPWTVIPDGGVNGLTHLAADCTNLWRVRSDLGDLEVVRIRLADGGSAPVGTKSLFYEVYSVGSDDGYLYLGRTNVGGLHAFDKTTLTIEEIAPGSVWRLAVDDDGVYWGEHSSRPDNEMNQPVGGAIYMLQKQK